LDLQWYALYEKLLFRSRLKLLVQVRHAKVHGKHRKGGALGELICARGLPPEPTHHHDNETNASAEEQLPFGEARGAHRVCSHKTGTYHKTTGKEVEQGVVSCRKSHNQNH